MSRSDVNELVASLVLAQKETDRQLKETDRQLKETGQQLKETDRKIDRIASIFGQQLGRMTEALVEPACLKLFQQRGVEVHQTMRRVRARFEGEEIEIDVLLVNSGELVAIEVKSAFRVEDVNDLLADLERFRRAFPSYAAHKVYGGVAALEFLEDADRFAYRRGLFVLKFTGELMDLVSPPNFKPKAF